MEAKEPVYYAKSPNAFGIKTTVGEHLTAVSRLSAQYAAPMDMEEEGALVGLLHDFGKYSDRFQKVLRGEMTGIDHAHPGALLTLNLPYYITETIAAHHDGLINRDPGVTQYGKLPVTRMVSSGKYSALQSNEDFVSAKKALYADIDKTVISGLFQKVASHTFEQETGLKKDLLHMLRSRMLLSCLVDADYSTSAFERDQDQEHFSEGIPLDAQASLDRLREKQGKSAANPCPDNIKQLRDMVWNDCEDAAGVNASYMTLTAPTGSGKTFGFLNYALSKCIKDKTRKRIIIVLPFLSLVDQVAETATEIIPGTIVDTSTAEYSDEARDLTERWSAPCVVTTTVQFFGSLFSRQPGDVRKLHRLSDAVIVFDEIQALPNRLAETALEMLFLLSKHFKANILLSTATPPSYGKIPNLDYTPVEIIKDIPKCFSLAPAERITYMGEEQPLDHIADLAAEGNNTAVICNLKRHAMTIYRQWEKMGLENIYLLSTDLCPAHRREIIRAISKCQKEGVPVHVSATQCIEAGVDLDFEQIYRAMAPLSSLIQSAGRQNRARKRPQGSMYVFAVKRSDEDSKRMYPDTDYEKQSHTAQSMAIEGLPLWELSSLDHYYAILFTQKNLTPREVVAATEEGDYQAYQDNTKIIDRSGQQVIVPYNDSIWQECLDAVHRDCVTKVLLRKVSAYTVQSYDTKAIASHCQELILKNRRFEAEIHTGVWVILEGHEKCYDKEKTGLTFTGDTGIFL